MDETLRWEVIDRLEQAENDGMVIWDDDQEVPWFPDHTWQYWRDALRHPYAVGHGHCQTCGAGGPCPLATFKDAYAATILRELDRMGFLRPPPTCCPTPDMWFDRNICPEPCGSMHDRCNNCLTTMGGCVLESVGENRHTQAFHGALSTLADNVRRLRKAQGWTRKEMAQRADMDRQAVRSIEDVDLALTMNLWHNHPMVQRLARSLGTTVEELWSDRQV